jgi:Tol biopolymer transport system component
VWQRPYASPPTPDGWFDISTDGRGLVFRGDQQFVPDEPGLYVGRIGELTYRRLPGTDLAAQPFWSADGTSIGFLVDNRLMRVRLNGDPPQEIGRIQALFGADWNETGVILLGTPAGIQRVSAEGGAPEVIVPKADSHAGLYWPHFLPGGRRFLYLAWAANPGDRAIMAASLDDPTPVKVMSAESNAVFAPAGYLIFHRGDAVFAQPFDAGASRISGETTRLAAGVEFSSSNGFGAFSVAVNGTLVYFQSDQTGIGSGQQERVWQPHWVERTGQATPVGSIQRYRGAAVSPDGKRIAFHRHEDIGGDIWILEPSGTETRLTFDPSRDNSSPIWSPPDGRFIVFGAKKDGKWGLYRRLSDARGTEEKLFESERLVTPMSWSPDGRRIVFGLGGEDANSDLWVLTLESADGAVSTSDKAQAFASTPADETYAQISRDGRWLAYASDETRRSVYEVYVRPFPAGPSRWQVSRSGGKWPAWSKDGRELLFMLNVPDNQSTAQGFMRRVKFSAKGDVFIPEPEVEFLRLRALSLNHPGGDYPTYAVGDNGRILVFTLAPPAATASAASVSPDWDNGLTVLRFWEHAIRRR